MGLKSWLFGNFIEEIEWKDNDKELLFYKFPLEDKEVSYNAKLKVNEGEVAIFALNSKVFDTFTLGEYLINSETLPNIAKELKWDESFDEPLKLDIYFINKDSFKFWWDTKEPILLHDKDNAIAKLEASGTFRIHIYRLKLFLEFILSSKDKDFKNAINTFFYDALIDALINRKVSIFYLGSNKDYFSEFLFGQLITKFNEIGLMLEKIDTNILEVEQELPNYTGIYSEQKEDNPIYYIIKHSKPDGPYTKSEIIQLINDGKLIAASYIWKDGLENWVKLKELFDLDNLGS